MIADYPAWTQISLTTHQGNGELYSDYLMQAGALAVTLQDAAEQPLLEPLPGETPLWSNLCVVGLFERNVNLNAIQAFLNQHLDAHALGTLRITRLAEQNWIHAWRDQFHAMRFGKRLWVCPSDATIPDPTAIPVLLDPGLAFGTGTHPTTRLCLTWLDSHPPQDAYVIDYGCGSGILGLAALKLGASFVHAIDYDPQAILSTQQNAQRNEIQEDKLLSLLPDEFLQLPRQRSADLILANILADPLIELEPLFARCSRPDGILVLSGLLKTQTELVFQHYEQRFRLLEVETQEEWARLTLKAK